MFVQPPEPVADCCHCIDDTPPLVVMVKVLVPVSLQEVKLPVCETILGAT